jgi:hypothetical protein
VPGPRDYRPATERALWELAKGACYAPACEAPATTFLGGEPYSNLEIAHIYGAKPGSARYQSDMSDEQRRAFANLILLCRPHHELVDRRSPTDFPAPVLLDWKQAREASLEAPIESIAGLNEDQLALLLDRVVRDTRSVRQIEVDPLAGVLVASGVVTGPISADFRQVIATNPTLVDGERVLVLHLRNVGSAAVQVTSVDIVVDVALNSAERGPGQSASAALKGRNDYLGINPELPARLLDGEALTWLTSVGTIHLLWRGLRQGAQVPHALHGEVGLATGEVVRTARLSIDAILEALS